MNAPVITLQQYLMGRDKTHDDELTPEILRNAEDLLRRVNLLLPLMGTVDFEPSPKTKSVVSSGWRPRSINEATPGAAPKSLHMTGQAIDLYDPDGDIDFWCWKNQHILAAVTIDLYFEHPAITKGWCHLQSKPPKSQAQLPISERKRWFYV